MISKNKMVLLVICNCLMLSPLSYSQNWSYELEPYVLFSSIEGDAGIGRVSGAPVDVDFGDILEVLDLGAMGHFEAHHESGWGFSLDYGFMDLAADISTARGGVIDASVRQGVLEALGMYRSNVSGGQLDAFFGLRWWDNDIDIRVDPAILPGTLKSDIEEDWVDLVVGIRWLQPINNSWNFVLRGDIGGLGVESEFTSSLAAGFQYQMSANWVLDLQYKSTWVDFEDGSKASPDYFAYDTVTHGPLLGLIYKF